MNRELSDAREHAGKGLEHTSDVIHRIHISRIEAGDHWIKAGLFLLGKGLVGHCDPSVGEGVVIQRSICLQIVAGSTIAIDSVRPLLLQWNTEYRDPAHLVAHSLEKVVAVSCLLDIVSHMGV